MQIKLKFIQGGMIYNIPTICVYLNERNFQGADINTQHILMNTATTEPQDLRGESKAEDTPWVRPDTPMHLMSVGFDAAALEKRCDYNRETHSIYAVIFQPGQTLPLVFCVAPKDRTSPEGSRDLFFITPDMEDSEKIELLIS